MRIYRVRDKEFNDYYDDRASGHVFINMTGRVIWFNHGLLEDITDLVVLEWCTGKQDELHKKDLYQGDIIDYLDALGDACLLGDMINKTRGVIKWIPERCQFMAQEIAGNSKGGHYYSHWDTMTKIKLIGNINQHPDLLKQ